MLLIDFEVRNEASTLAGRADIDGTRNLSRAAQCGADLLTAIGEWDRRLNSVPGLHLHPRPTSTKRIPRFSWGFHFLLLLAAGHLRHGRHNSHAIGFGFQRVVLDHGDAAAERISHASLFLLKHVPEFVAQ